MELNAPSFFLIVAVKNCSFRRATVIQINIFPMELSTFGLTLGLCTLADIYQPLHWWFTAIMQLLGTKNFATPPKNSCMWIRVVISYLLLFINKCFHISVLAIGHNTYEEPGFCDLPISKSMMCTESPDYSTSTRSPRLWWVCMVVHRFSSPFWK